MAKTVGRLKQGDMLIAGEINERLPAVRNGLIAHFPFDETEKRYVPNKIRYIRDWVNGSTANAGDHWVEIQAIDYNRINVALSKTVTTNGTVNVGSLGLIVDGDTASANYCGIDVSFPVHVVVDLGASYNIEEIKVWHYYADGRTYYDTKTEVSEDGKTWYSIFDSLIEGTYAETSTGKIHKLQFLGSTVGSINNNNTTPTPHGIAVEEATTNLFKYPSSFENSVWSKESAITVNPDSVIAPDGSHTADKIIYGSTGYRYFHQYNVATGAAGFLANRTFTISCWMRGQAGGEGMTFQIRPHGGTIAYHSKAFTLTKDWVRYTHTVTIPSTDDNTALAGLFLGDLNNTYHVWGAQIEEKKYAISLVDGSKSRGLLTIRNPFKGTAGSMHIKAQMLNGEPYATEYKSLFGNVWSNNAFFSFINKSNGVLYGYYPNTAATPSHTYYDFGYYPAHMDEFDITLTWSGTTFKYYLNGVLKGTKTDCDSARIANSFTELHLCSHPNYSNFGLMKSMSAYDRDLTDAEVKKLSTNTFSITKEGDILSGIKEGSNNIPNDILHFPLGVNSKDRYHVVDPNTESNTVYENGTMWLGNATTNLHTGEKTNLGAGASTVFENDWEKVTVTTANHGRRYYVDLAKLTDGATYTSSVTAYNPNSSAISITVDWCDTGVTSYTIQPFETKRINVVSSRATYDTTYRFFDVILSTTGEYWVKDVQVEHRGHITPYTLSSRGDGDIKYPLTFTDNATFNFWHKREYLNSFSGQSVSPNIFEIGNYYSNSSLTLWNYSSDGNIVCFGRQDAATGWTWTNTIVSSLTVDYWKKWHMYTVVITGASGTVTGWKVYIDGVLKAERTGLTITSWNGSFYGMGAHGGTRPNAYYKDLLYVPRAMIDSDIQAIYKTQMRAYKDNRLQVQGQVREGKVL